MQEKSLRHQAALQFAEAGIPIFPCVPDGKQPATAHGFHDATTDPTQINAWWAEADYNLAFTPHSVGWGIVDIDGPEGEAAWAELANKNGVPETYTIRTPRGGRHLYFEGELPTTAWNGKGGRALGVHLDTRGRGSYALLPPSVVGGKPYVVDADVDVAPLPAWVPAALISRATEAKASVTDLDLPANIARARQHLQSLADQNDVAVEGKGGNNRTYVLACDLLNLGLSPDTAQSLIEDLWNPHCIPPWDSEELATVIGNATEYAQNEGGAWAVSSPSQTFAAKALDQLAAEGKAERRSRFYFENVEEQDLAPDPKWLFRDLIPDQATVLLLAKSGDFKSFLAQHLALSLVADRSFGTIGGPTRTGPAFYAAHEGRNDIKKARRLAWQMAHGLERDDLRKFFVAPAPFVVLPEQVDEFKEQIRVRCRELGEKPALIILDTVAKCMMGLDENSAKDCGIFIAFCDGLRDEFGCSVLSLHHLGKNGAESGRGSSALVAGFDTILGVKRVPETFAVELRVQQHKDAEERRTPWTFEGKKVGPSLVFQPTTDKEHKQIAGAHNVFERRRVGQALAELRAYGYANGVTTLVLASKLMPPTAEMDAEAALALNSRTARSLRGLARMSLEAYCEKAGKELIWFLPEAPTAE